MTRIALALAVSLSLVSAAQAAPPDAAVRLAHDAIVVDTHIDAPTGLLEHWNDLGQSTPSREFDYPRARAGGLDVAFMSIYTSPDQDEAGEAWQVANQQIDAVEALAARHPKQFALLTSPRDVERLRKGGRVLLALGMENGGPIGDDLAQLAHFHARGVRYITLAHGRNNRISDSSTDEAPRWHGLSPFGEQVVGEMNRLGMMVDVSHVSDEAIRDVLAISHAPVIASHSALRHFTPGFPRNLPDELVQAIAAKGGVVQVPFGSMFLDARGAAAYMAFVRERAAFRRAQAEALAAGKPRAADQAPEFPKLAPAPLAAVLDNIDRVVELGGIDHVGIGSDFDGVDGALPLELRSVEDYPVLVAALQERGYGETEIRKLLGGNVLRVWREVEAAAAH